MCPAHSPLPAVPCSRDAPGSTWPWEAPAQPSATTRALQTGLSRAASAKAATVTFLLSSSLSSEQEICRAQKEDMSELQTSIFLNTSSLQKICNMHKSQDEEACSA